MSPSRFSPVPFFITAVLAFASTALAQKASAPPAKLTLDAAIEEAFEHSPAVRVIDADVESARGEVLTAQTRPPPELTFSPNIRRLNESEGAHHEFLGSLELSQTFLFPGKRELMVSLAQRNVELRRLATDGLRFQLAANVRKAFYELLAAQSVIGVRRDQLASAEAFAAATSRRAESGYASDFEAVKSQGDVIAARKLLVAAEGAIAAARVELNLLLGREAAAPVEADGTLTSDAGEIPVGDLVSAALAQNPSLRVQAMQAQIAALNVRKARLARKPDLAIGPSLEVSKSEQILGLSATIPLPGKNYGRGEVLTASAEQRKVTAENEALRREIVAAVTKAATDLATARQELALYSPAYLERLKSVATQAEQSYGQNVTSLLIYLDARRTYFDALADYYDAIAHVATSRATLESAVGAPLDSFTSTSNR
jgi:cobalt-zinc-cadmium efflux system outer membrane protein